MAYRKYFSWHRNHHRGGSGSGGTKGSGHSKASATKSYHNGGVEGEAFAAWYDANLAKDVADIQTDHEGSGSGGTKGSGSGGTKGSGSGGTKGSGSGGTKGSGSGGTKGSGSGGTKGSGSGGTKGSGEHSCNDDGSEKPTQTVEFGDPSKITMTVTQTPAGQLFFSMEQTSYEGEITDIQGIGLNMTDNATLTGLNFFPDPLALPVTGFAADADAVNTLPDGTSLPNTFDAVVQFGQVPSTTDGAVNTANFTLWSDNGPLTLNDLDLSQLSMVVENADGSTDVLGASMVDGEPCEHTPEGSGGTKGSGSGGTKGSGSGGTKGSGSGGTNGSGSGGTKGSGSGGTKGSGSGGTNGSGSGGTKGSGSGGIKGSGSGGTNGSGSGGTKGSGSGSTKGSGSGGTKGSGSGGTKGSGGTTGGWSQWSGIDASAAASTLPAFEVHPEDQENDETYTQEDVMSLMTQNIDGEDEAHNWGSATAGEIDMEMF